MPLLRGHLLPAGQQRRGEALAREPMPGRVRARVEALHAAVGLEGVLLGPRLTELREARRRRLHGLQRLRRLHLQRGDLPRLQGRQRRPERAPGARAVAAMLATTTPLIFAGDGLPSLLLACSSL